MSYHELLEQIKSAALRLGVSPVHGVGVFAVRDIAKGTRNIFSEDRGEWIKVPVAEVEKLPEHARKLIENYCTFDKQDYYVEKYAFRKLDICSSINHDENPNIIAIENGRYFQTLRDIKEGEELFIDYGTIAEE
jgi:SET domain-containing protein